MKIKKLLLLLIASFVFSVNPRTQSFKVVAEEQVSNALTVKMINLNAEGDCFLISYGLTQILVDCGANSLFSHLKEFGTDQPMERIRAALNEEFNGKDDKVLDYVLISHMDEDHISCFYDSVNDSLYSYLLENKMTIGTLIDTDMTMDKTIKNIGKYDFSLIYSSGAYSKYKIGRDLMISDGGKDRMIGKYYTASQCVVDMREDLSESEKSNFYKKSVLANNVSINPTLTSKDKFTNEFNLDASGKAKIRILYNPYYVETSENVDVSKVSINEAKNILSLCFTIEFDNEKWLFTGDLMEYLSKDGSDTSDDFHANYAYFGAETLLVQKNKDVFFKKTKSGYEELDKGFIFYKAAHHGSDSSNGKYLMDVIKPRYIGISAQATVRDYKNLSEDSSVNTDLAMKKYPFPGQFALNQMTKWTDKIAITCKREYKNLWHTVPYYGDVVYKYENGEMIVTNSTTESYNETESILENDWFLKNRQFETKVYNLSGNGLSAKSSDDPSYDSKNGDCEYIKVGSVDILINCGVDGVTPSNKYYYKKSIEHLCNDNVLEYVIITDCNIQSFSEFKKLYSDGYFGKCKIKNVILPIYKNDISNTYTKLFNKLVKDNSINLITKPGTVTLFKNNYSSMSLTILDNAHYINQFDDPNDAFAVLYNVSVKKTKDNVGGYYSYLNMGQMSDSNAIDAFIKNGQGQSYFKNLNIEHVEANSNTSITLQLPRDGSHDLKKDILLNYFARYVNFDYAFINAPSLAIQNDEQNYPRLSLSNEYGRKIYATQRDVYAHSYIINENLYNSVKIGLNQYKDNKSSTAKYMIQSNIYKETFDFDFDIDFDRLNNTKLKNSLPKTADSLFQ